MSGIRVAIENDLMRQGINVMFYRPGNDGTTVWAPGGDVAQFVQPGVQAENIEPFRIREDEALALLAALNRHFDGGEDTRALRRDYDHERKRVDQFIAHLTREA